MAEEQNLGPVGTKLLIANELVNVWEVRLEPGESQPLHFHEFPYVVISIESGQARITEHQTGIQRAIENAPGNAVFDPGGTTHTLQNVGETTTLDRLIEFKTPRRPLDRVVVPANAS